METHRFFICPNIDSYQALRVALDTTQHLAIAQGKFDTVLSPDANTDTEGKCYLALDVSWFEDAAFSEALASRAPLEITNDEYSCVNFSENET